MITQTRPAFYDADRYAEYCGLSTDDKATIDAKNADSFYEIDTGTFYRYTAATNEWIEQPAAGEAINEAVPPMSTETAGKFLSNDGLVTHWQEFASADFVITLTENGDGTYTADKTYVQIKAAYDGKENIAVSLDSARLPLMNAQFADNGDAGFTFGYTQVTTDGQLVSTRGINYSHSAATNHDEWTDVDQVGEYLKVAGGTINGNISMAANSITDVQELSTADQHPLYLGNIIHPDGTAGVRITSTTNDEAAVVSPSSQSVYKPINVGAPSAPNHAVNLAYLTQEVKDDAATKNHVEVAKNSAITIGLQDGVYFVSACNTIHRGAYIVYMCGSTTTLSALTGVVGWEATKGAKDNSLYLNNKSDVSAVDVYIAAIGAGSAI